MLMDEWTLAFMAPMHRVAPLPRQAWLPQEQIRPLMGPSEQEILEALGGSANIRKGLAA